MDYVSRDSDKIRELLQRCLILPEWAKNAIQEQCDNNFRNEWNIEGLLNVDGEYVNVTISFCSRLQSSSTVSLFLYISHFSTFKVS